MTTPPLTDAELQEARKLLSGIDHVQLRADRAADSPFMAADIGDGVWWYVDDVDGGRPIACRDEEVALFIASAFTLVPRLLDALATATARVAEIEAERDDARRHWDAWESVARERHATIERMAPVVEAAKEWSEQNYAVTISECALARAVDALAKGGGQ